MGLMCEDRHKINLIEMAYLIAYGCVGLFVFPLPDRWGCRKTMAVFGTMHVCAQLCCLLIPIYFVRLVCLAVLGGCALKNATSYAWLFGLIMSKDISVVCGFLNAWDLSTITVMVCYFLFISKNWVWLFFPMTALGLASHCFMMVFSPESPKWLLAKGKREEAIAAFNTIARWNRSPNFLPKDATFDEIQERDKPTDTTNHV